MLRGVAKGGVLEEGFHERGAERQVTRKRGNNRCSQQGVRSAEEEATAVDRVAERGAKAAMRLLEEGMTVGEVLRKRKVSPRGQTVLRLHDVCLTLFFRARTENPNALHKKHTMDPNCRRSDFRMQSHIEHVSKYCAPAKHTQRVLQNNCVTM